MINLIVILFLLWVPFLLLRFAGVPARLRGRISLALVFAFTAAGHFLKTREMATMLPAWVPNREAWIQFTGFVEYLGAVALLVPSLSRIAGICLCLFLVAVFPANVFAAVNRVEFGGHGAGPLYLAVRLPLQLLLIGWAYWFAVRKETPA
jgi:uncharacterized membrane protein